LSFVDWERRYTQRYENAIYQRIQTTSIEQVSREEELSWDQVQGILTINLSQKKRLGEVKRLSIDEISQRKGSKILPQLFVTLTEVNCWK
jgi:transposase